MVCHSPGLNSGPPRTFRPTLSYYLRWTIYGCPVPWKRCQYRTYIYVQWSLTYLTPLICNIHLSEHLFGNQFIFLTIKLFIYPEIQLYWRLAWERRCPDKWGFTVQTFLNIPNYFSHKKCNTSYILQLLNMPLREFIMISYMKVINPGSIFRQKWCRHFFHLMGPNWNDDILVFHHQGFELTAWYLNY